MEGSTKYEVLFSGALPFNWGDSNKPGLLSCKFVMRLWFCQHVPECGDYYSHYLFSPFQYIWVHASRSDSLKQGILNGMRLVARGYIKMLGKGRECQKLDPKYVWYLPPWLFTPSYMLCVYKHTWTPTTINGKNVFERRQDWKLHASIYWTLSCLPHYMISIKQLLS